MGTPTTANFGLTHTYNSSGDYDISIQENIAGGFPRILFSNRGDKLKVLEIANWGAVTWSTFIDAFYGCSNMQITAQDGIFAKTSAVASIRNAWRNCSALTSFPFINLSSCTDAAAAWRDCFELNDFAQVDLSNVNNFTYTWGNCGYIENFPAINMKSIQFGTNCFVGASIPTQSYTNIINILWENISSLNNGVTINFGTSTLGTSVQSKYNELISAQGGKFWTISDGGFVNGSSAFLASQYLYKTYFYCDKEKLDVVVHDGVSKFEHFSLTLGQSLKSELPYIEIYEEGKFSLFVSSNDK